MVKTIDEIIIIPFSTLRNITYIVLGSYIYFFPMFGILCLTQYIVDDKLYRDDMFVLVSNDPDI